MSINILVMGQSGTGKSCSLRHLDPATTCLIKIINKPLPFKIAKEAYKPVKKDEKGERTGNLCVCDNADQLVKIISWINAKRKDIKTLIIDDFQYLMANEYMYRSDEKGFNKFTDLAKHTWEVINATQQGRPDLLVYYLTHSELDNNNMYKAKTIGKLLDEKITLEGMFTVVLHSLVLQDKYLFLTQHDGSHIAKSPLGMFQEKYIENDLNQINEKIKSYYEFEDIPQ